MLRDYDANKPYFLSGGIDPSILPLLESFPPQLYALDVNSKFEIQSSKEIFRD